MQYKPLLKYPGSKATRSTWITSYFPEHKVYVEPFMGSAAVFFAKEPAEHEVLNDLSNSVVHLFRMIRERGPELADLISFTPWSRTEYEMSYESVEDDLERARRFLVRCWQAHGTRLNGKTGWRHRGPCASGSTASLWQKLPDRLLAVVDRLRDAEIECKPALDIIAEYDTPDTLLYVDPPYILETRHGALYEHEMSLADHHALLDALQAHNGMVILSGYAHPVYDERLKDWQRVTMPSLAEKGKVQLEVLWLNKRASRAQQLSLFEDVV